MADALTRLFFALFVAIGLAMMLGPRLWRPGRARYRRRRPAFNRLQFDAADLASPFAHRQISDAADQLRIVSTASYEPRQLLSKSEAKIFYWAEDIVKESDLPWRVMAQVAIGQVLASPDKAAHAAINAKRVDLLVITNSGFPVVAIEYQGEGHYQGNAPIRDAIKREAFRRAGIGFLEVTPAQTRDDLKRELLRFASASKQEAQAGAGRL